jgi:hypothetical protein
MTSLDELIRTALQSTADEQGQPADLAANSMQAGRQIRRRRRMTVSVAAVASVVVLVGGSVAIADSIGHDRKVQTISPLAQPPTPWQSWTPDRVFGAKPDDAFINAATQGPAAILASGTMSDNTNFVAYVDQHDSGPAAGEGSVPNFVQGWNNVDDFGEGASEGPKAGPDASYLALQSPTLQAHQASDVSSQWLIVVGEPGTTAASYSADGTTWQPMQVQDGIAVLELPGIAPRGAQLRLSDASGQYATGLVSPPSAS